jgi:hypothetical protein
VKVGGAYPIVQERWRRFVESGTPARLAAWFGGFAAGCAFVVLSSYGDYLAVTVPLLFISLIWLSVWFRHFGSVIGAMIAAWLWQPLLAAHQPPSYADVLTFDFARDGVLVFIGLVVPVIAHATSLLFRRRPGRTHQVRIAVGLGLASILVFSVTEGVQALVPTNRSFEVTLPVGWTTYNPVTREGDLVPAMYGADFSAVNGSTAPEADLDRPPAPLVGVTVYGAWPDSVGSIRCDIWSGWAGRTYGAYRGEDDWKSPQVSPAGAELQASRDGLGDSFFVLQAPRTRQIGLATQYLCYLLVVGVPASSSMSQTDIDAIFSSFRYR